MSEKSIKVILPENYQTHEKKYFCTSSIHIPLLKIVECRNALVSENGLVMRNDSLFKALMKESIYRYTLKYFGFRLDGLLRYGKSLIKHDTFRLNADKVYFTIATPWSPYDGQWHNYYHWLMDGIPRLLDIYDKIPNMTLMIWDFYRKWDFVMKSLLPFRKLKIEIIPTGRLAYVPQLILPELRNHCCYYNKEKIERIKALYFDYFGTSEKLGNKIYITRRNNNRRKIVNENEVEYVLKKYGFETIDCDRIPIEKQISIMSHANTLVSVHGAALTNMIFLRPHSKVLEFHRQKMTPFDHHSKIFWQLSCCMNHLYYHQICIPVGKNKMKFFTSDFYVNIPELKKNIGQMQL